MFYWLRIFASTAFFYKLLTQTLVDITAFLVMLIVVLAMSANLFYITNIWRKSQYDVWMKSKYAEGVYDETIEGESFVSSLLYSYNLSLGEFGQDNFDGYTWTLFIFATFIVQITFMNMLIAIMGDTFDKVTDAKIESSLSEKISMLADFRKILKLFKIDLKAQYLFVVTPPEELQTDEDW